MLTTEAIDPRLTSIDDWPLSRALEEMLEGQQQAVRAVHSALGVLAEAAEVAALRLQDGGRLIYAGAGTSGRIAVQDGVELGPTYGWPADRLGYAVAGGMVALSGSVENAEDDAAAAGARAAALALCADDVVIGVAASGRTPFTLAFVTAARDAGAITIAIANNPGTPLLSAAAYGLLAETGAEPVAGSTRMKAGTAQKVMLNLLSTAIMLRLGRVHDGLMVSMVVSNQKLLIRARDIVMRIAGCTLDKATRALDDAALDIRQAVLIAKGASPAVATTLIAEHRGHLRSALAALEAGR